MTFDDRKQAIISAERAIYQFVAEYEPAEYMAETSDLLIDAMQGLIADPTFEAAMRALYRNAALEDAAKKCDALVHTNEQYLASDCAAAIREMKSE